MSKFRYVAIAALLLVASTAQAGVFFQSLGTNPPPPAVGWGIALTPFDEAAQAAIVDGTSVTDIPGSPIPGTLTSSIALGKRTIGAGWATWSHGYTGPVFANFSASPVALTLPANATAFYVYVEPNSFAEHTIEAVTNTGRSSGLIPVVGASGATGFAFYATDGDTIASITITAAAGANGFAIGEFGIGTASVNTRMIPTVGFFGLVLSVLALAGAGLFLLRHR